jgi:hypothetical protein
MDVELGAFGRHEAADQVGAQRKTDVLVSAHDGTAPGKPVDRITCPLTCRDDLWFTWAANVAQAITTCWPTCGESFAQSRQYEA